jgi:hypothetical protein
MKYLWYIFLTIGLFGCGNSHQYPERTLPKHIPIRIENLNPDKGANFTEAIFWGINNCKEIKLRKTYLKSDSLWVEKFNYTFPTPINTNLQGIDLETLLKKENPQVKWDIDTTTYDKSKILNAFHQIKSITAQNDSLLFLMGSCTNRAIWIYHNLEEKKVTTYDFLGYDEKLVNLFLKAYNITL